MPAHNIKKATCTFLPHTNRAEEVHLFAKHGDAWLPVTHLELLQEASRIVLEDGTIIKDQKGDV